MEPSTMLRKRIVGGTSGTGIFIGEDVETNHCESQLAGQPERRICSCVFKFLLLTTACLLVVCMVQYYQLQHLRALLAPQRSEVEQAGVTSPSHQYPDGNTPPLPYPPLPKNRPRAHNQDMLARHRQERSMTDIKSEQAKEHVGNEQQARKPDVLEHETNVTPNSVQSQQEMNEEQPLQADHIGLHLQQYDQVALHQPPDPVVPPQHQTDSPQGGAAQQAEHISPIDQNLQQPKTEPNHSLGDQGAPQQSQEHPQQHIDNQQQGSVGEAVPHQPPTDQVAPLADQGELQQEALHPSPPADQGASGHDQGELQQGASHPSPPADQEAPGHDQGELQQEASHPSPPADQGAPGHDQGELQQGASHPSPPADQGAPGHVQVKPQQEASHPSPPADQ